MAVDEDTLELAPGLIDELDDALAEGRAALLAYQASYTTPA